MSNVCAAPGPPASLRFESPSEKSVVLYWSPPAETNGILLGYVVQYLQGNVDVIRSTSSIRDHPNTCD